MTPEQANAHLIAAANALRDAEQAQHSAEKNAADWTDAATANPTADRLNLAAAARQCAEAVQRKTKAADKRHRDALEDSLTYDPIDPRYDWEGRPVAR